MKISVVTISYNQARYLPACINSISVQEDPWEHIIVDPGSTDGSRDIISSFKDHFSHIKLEKDSGPADGLNQGFAWATGDIYYYLNADDVVFPESFSQVRRIFSENPHADVITGHGFVIDDKGKRKRRVWSDKITRHALALGGCICIQPATFIRADAFKRTSGFNAANRSNWDGELIVDLYLAGSCFLTVEYYWGGYRLYAESITGGGKMPENIRKWSERRYQKVMAKPKPWYATGLYHVFRVKRLVKRPSRLLDRLRGGIVYGGGL